jgi:hypothetical protein
MQDKSQLYRFEIRAPKRVWRGCVQVGRVCVHALRLIMDLNVIETEGCVQVGVVVVDGEWSSEERAAMRTEQWPPSSVTWPLGASLAATREGMDKARFTDLPGKFVPGNVVGMMLSNWHIHFFVATDAAQPMTLVKQVLALRLQHRR